MTMVSLSGSPRQVVLFCAFMNGDELTVSIQPTRVTIEYSASETDPKAGINKGDIEELKAYIARLEATVGVGPAMLFLSMVASEADSAKHLIFLLGKILSR